MKSIAAKVGLFLLGVGTLAMLSQPVLAQPAGPGIVDERDGTVITDPGAAQPCNQYLLTFPAWYRGIANDGDCSIKSPTEVGNGTIGNFIWTIALNIIEILLNLVGYAAVGFIIYGGYKYMISAGSPDGMVAARKTILNAVIGLAISIAAVAIVRTISIGIGLGG